MNREAGKRLCAPCRATVVRGGTRGGVAIFCKSKLNLKAQPSAFREDGVGARGEDESHDGGGGVRNHSFCCLFVAFASH